MYFYFLVSLQDDVMSKIRKSSGANYDLGSNAQVLLVDEALSY